MMHAWVKYGSLLLCCLLAAEARAQSCTTPLVEVGPLSAANGFPRYYVDATQLALEPCLDPVGFCPPMGLPDPTAPVVFPGNFPAAFLYWVANARVTLPSGGRARLTLAVEGTFVGGVVAPGKQLAFGRVRIRADGLVAGATYRFTHPYGVDVLQADGAGGLDVSNTVGTAGFTGPLGSRLGPFLVRDASPPAPAAGVCRFTGFNTSPCDDGNACTVTDTCLLGSCAGTPRTCDDANVCTADSCDPATGCVNAPRPGPCDDRNACTTGDTCAGGQCV